MQSANSGAGVIHPLGKKPYDVKMTGNPGGRDRLLELQYVECWADIRNYDSMIWQIPAVAYVINGILLTVLLNGNLRGGESILAAAIMLPLTLPLTIALVKNRYFQMARLNECRRIANELGSEHVPSITPEVAIDLPRQPVVGGVEVYVQRTFRAYFVLLLMLALGHLGQLTLIILTTLRTL